MAHTKSGGKTRNGRDSKGQRHGIKRYAGEIVGPGEIIVRQKGTRWHPGNNVKKSSNDTIYSMVDGKVTFKKKKVLDFTGNLKKRTFVSVIPA